MHYATRKSVRYGFEAMLHLLMRTGRPFRLSPNLRGVNLIWRTRSGRCAAYIGYPADGKGPMVFHCGGVAPAMPEAFGEVYTAEEYAAIKMEPQD